MESEKIFVQKAATGASSDYSRCCRPLFARLRLERLQTGRVEENAEER